MEPRHNPSVSISLLILSMLVLILSSIGAASPGPDVLVVDSYVPYEFKELSDVSASDFTSAMKSLSRTDHIRAYYQNPDTRLMTLSFFEQLTGNYHIARAILDESIAKGVPPALAFALAYEESGYDPQAFNRNPQSVDRGLFQLNSSSFPSLSITEFYDVATNARIGMAHLAYCLQQGGNEVAALAVYNAGLGRVSKGGTPRQTLDYIHRITGNRERLEALFEAQVVARHSESSSIAAALSSAADTN